ncbi:MAG: hypothetical protein ABR606_00875 [Vicinamibacterales bacterium]
MWDVCTFGRFRFDPADGPRRGNVEALLPPRALAVLAVPVSRPGTLRSSPARHELRMVVEWFAELRRLVRLPV